jgi:hypothetical protein
MELGIMFGYVVVVVVVVVVVLLASVSTCIGLRDRDRVGMVALPLLRGGCGPLLTSENDRLLLPSPFFSTKEQVWWCSSAAR